MPPPPSLWKLITGQPVDDNNPSSALPNIQERIQSYLRVEDTEIRRNMKRAALRLQPGENAQGYKASLLAALMDRFRFSRTDPDQSALESYLDQEESFCICARANLPRSWSINALIGFHAFIQLDDGEIIEWTQIRTSNRFKDWPQKEERTVSRWEICRIISAAAWLGYGRPQYVISLQDLEILPRQNWAPVYLPPLNDCFTHVNKVLALADQPPIEEIRRVNGETVIQWVVLLVKAIQQ